MVNKIQQTMSIFLFIFSSPNRNFYQFFNCIQCIITAQKSQPIFMKLSDFLTPFFEIYRQKAIKKLQKTGQGILKLSKFMSGFV